MAEYRNGDDAAAQKGLIAAQQSRNRTGEYRARVIGTARFFGAMSLFRQGKAAEARTLFAEAEAEMKPLPAADWVPGKEGIDHYNIIVWLAYKEARALLQQPSKVTEPKADEKER